jgi:TATA-binding protein-associated factor Taf7
LINASIEALEQKVSDIFSSIDQALKAAKSIDSFTFAGMEALDKRITILEETKEEPRSELVQITIDKNQQTLITNLEAELKQVKEMASLYRDMQDSRVIEIETAFAKLQKKFTASIYISVITTAIFVVIKFVF